MLFIVVQNDYTTNKAISSLLKTTAGNNYYNFSWTSILNYYIIDESTVLLTVKNQSYFKAIIKIFEEKEIPFDVYNSENECLKNYQIKVCNSPLPISKIDYLSIDYYTDTLTLFLSDKSKIVKSQAPLPLLKV